MNLPARMRVARSYAPGDVRVEEVETPRPRAGEIVMRVDACGVCGSDALDWYIDGKVAAGPVVLGHEPAGVVAAAGAGVPFREGDRVFAHHHAACHRCEECRRGLWPHCTTWRRAALEPGGFAEFTRVSAAAVAHDTLPVPESLSLEEATFIEPLACCVRALRRHAALRHGEAVLVIGLGAIGLLLAQLARAYGAGAVVGSDFIPARREKALDMGVDGVFDPGGADALEVVRATTGGRGADIVIVCPGTAEAVAQALDAAAPGGRVVCFTPLPPDRTLQLPQSGLYFREVALLHSYSCGPDETREALRLLAGGRVIVRDLITHRTGLDGVGDALERAKGKELKSIVLPGERAAAPD